MTTISDVGNDAETADPCSGTHHVHRRTFLAGAVATAVGASLGAGIGSSAYAAALTREQRDKLTPDQIIEMMKQGNIRFRKGKKTVRDFRAQRRATAAGQSPAAVILSCIDSRAPVEIIMDLRIGDVFNARVAGNIANQDILGSMEFGCKLSGAKVVVVMGHMACGAIKGAIDKVELGNLTSLLATIRPAVEATQYAGEHSAKNDGYVDAVARTNVTMTMAAIRSGSAVLAAMEAAGSIKIAGAMYNLETGEVEFFT